MAGGWVRLHNEDRHNLYASQNIIKVFKSRWMRWAIHVARMGEMKNSYNILVGKLEAMRPFGIPRHRRENNVRTDRRDLEWRGVDWIHLA